jgi:hypothetical protein
VHGGSRLQGRSERIRATPWRRGQDAGIDPKFQSETVPARRRRAPEGHRWAGFGFHLTASAVSATTRRLVTLRLGERFALRFGSDHVANLSQRLNARREEVTITIDDRRKLPFEKGGSLIG